jgi:hypothetical protein
MTTRTFPQGAIVVATLLTALQQRTLAAVTAKSLADAVRAQFPDVPIAVLRALAAAALYLAYSPDAVQPDDVARHADSPAEASAACRWMAAALHAAADELRPVRRVR